MAESTLVGRQIGVAGRYRLLRRLGSGGMGEVYEAEVVPLFGRRVAIKVLDASRNAPPDFARRFRREAQTIAALRHPQILPVQDFGEEDDGLYYLVMDLVSGGTLADWLAREPSPWPPSRVLPLARQLVAALDYAHGQGVVHRDIKPANVLLEPDASVPGGTRAYLADFGVAKLVAGAQPAMPAAGTATLTVVGTSVGTPAYMSPEQIRNDPLEPIDGRSDLYSLGVVLYELLAGRLPFGGRTPSEIAARHLIEPLPPPRSVNPDLPEPLADVLVRALEKDSAARYSSVAELGRALEAAAAAPADASPVVEPTGPAVAQDDLDSRPTVAIPAVRPMADHGSQVSTPGIPAPAGAAPMRRTWPSGLLIAGGVLLALVAIGGFAIPPLFGLARTSAAAPTPTTAPAATKPVQAAPATPVPAPSPTPARAAPPPQGSASPTAAAKPAGTAVPTRTPTAPVAVAATLPPAPTGPRAYPTAAAISHSVPVGDRITYSSRPPSSGSHYSGNPAAYGVSEREIDPGYWVHTLEHGGIVVLYNCPQTCPEVVAQLRQVYSAAPPSRRHGNVKLAAIPYRDMDRRIAAVAWGWVDEMDAVDQARILDFYRQHVDNGPEDVP